MTRGERSWRDAGPEGTGLDQRTAPAEPTHEEDPLVEQAHEADPPPARLHEADPPPARLHGEDPLVEQAHEEDRVVERVDEVPATAASGPAADQEPLTQLVGADEHAGFVARWQEIQAGFVDEPKKAVHDADALVTDLMRRLAETLASERDQLESRMGAGGDVSTEDLRQGLRRYRSLFERLLAA
ncbi:MAG TPA: hypothetical protein VGQ26_23045 [Streptosporangiaceae bacterium]|jgi:hypothetical protein|nr:hypothetical protein [Streptosporangiaceae bacterium]